MMFNLVVAEIIFVLLLVLIIVWRWPDVPWTFLQYGGVSLMVILPFLLFPVSKVVWLSFDLLFRPATAEEFAPGEE